MQTKTHTGEMCRTLVDLALQVRLFLMYEFENFGCVVTKGMRVGWMSLREGNRKLLLLLPFFSCRRLAPLLLGLLRRFQFGAH
jgi:hypothetical protein